MKGIWACCIAVLLMVSIAGCAVPTLIPEDPATATSESGYGRVFGRIVLIEEGEEKDVSVWDSAGVFLRSLQSDKAQVVRITGDGRFNWPLRPGDYVIQSFSQPKRQARLWMSFRVPEPGRAAYIGDLRIEFARGRFRAVIADEYVAAVKREEHALREAKLTPVKALMQREVVGSYRRVVPICAKAWKIECDSTYQGVAAALPEGTNEGSPTTADLTPVLSWQPSPLEGVTYDVAIFEAPKIYGGVSRQRGRLVMYAEGLQEPKFQPVKPLRPDTGYRWSVRLRKGETVSTWTTTSYALFLIVAGAWGSGVWYGFQTPDN